MKHLFLALLLLGSAGSTCLAAPATASHARAIWLGPSPYHIGVADGQAIKPYLTPEQLTAEIAYADEMRASSTTLEDRQYWLGYSSGLRN